jgi:Thioredoxin
MKMVIADSLLRSHTYDEYRKIVSDLLHQGLSSGNEQSEDLTNYSKLNEVRMHRLDKTMTIDESYIQQLLSLKGKYIWLVLSEGWCGDAAQLLPVFNKMALHSIAIELKIVFRDENESLMNLFLTNGSKSIPKLLVLEKETLEVLKNWGPRPKAAAQLMKSYKEQYGKIDDTAKTELQMWYLHDKGLSTQNEIMEMMNLIEN